MNFNGLKFKAQFDLGTGPEVAIGPLGRKMDLNLKKLLFKKDIYAYSTIKGLFAGISLNGTVLTSDNKANREYYQQRVNNRILLSDSKRVKVPESAQAFLKRLNKLAPPPWFAIKLTLSKTTNKPLKIKDLAYLRR